ncbi:hypothetical protein BDQ12DRAFT_715450 [Crucibulum laeve]|uniref:F-box domain-containing protein n=1 Tax=Crucibulum laeve TaxID=68775 RepID=A0A5C3LZH1_9AGAR|nr:hypothetical protein BDQ12DRAFT_715450 [Crucibulum laeve]
MNMDIHQKCPYCHHVIEKALEQPFSELSYPPSTYFTRQGIVPDTSSAEHDAIINDISCGKSQISDIDERIGRLQGILQELEKEKKRMKTYVVERQTIFAPIRRLPADVLGEIFRMVAIDIMCDTKTPLPSISYVSYFWRSVSIELSELWSNVTIVLEPRLSRRNYEGVLETCLSRSNGRPFSFELHADFWGVARDNIFIAVVDLLLSHSRRWKNIFLKIPIQAHDQFLRARDAVPLLESVSLYGERPSPINWFENAPELRTLRLKYMPSPLIRCPWDQITTLHLDGSYTLVKSLYATLTQTSNLQELDIYVSAGRVQLPSDITHPVELQHLKKLSIRSNSAPVQNVGSILSIISATSLDELVVTTDNGVNKKEIIDRVISLVKGSMARKRLTVTLGDDYSVGEALTHLLLEIPGADAALQFEISTCTVEFLEAFMVKSKHLTLPDGIQLYNPFRIRSLGCQETIRDLIVATSNNPGLFKEEVSLDIRRQRGKLSFQRFLNSSQISDRKLYEGEIHITHARLLINEVE